MLERAAILATIAVAVLIGAAAVRALSSYRLRRLQLDGPNRLWSALGERPDGRPSLVVFSTPGCTVCRTTQYPAVESVVSQFGAALRVLSVDLADRPSVGRAFRVLTAPTTVLLGSSGDIARINHGFAPADVLAAQISGLDVSQASSGLRAQPARPAPEAPAPAARR